MRHTTDHQRRTVSILLIAGALTTLAGCGGGDEAEPVAAAGSPRPTRPPPTESAARIRRPRQPTAS